MKKLKLRLSQDKLFAVVAQIEEFIRDGKMYELVVQRETKRRSVDANALLWKACSFIADHLRTDKDSVYKQMLFRYGVSILCKIPDKYKEQFLRNEPYVQLHETLPKEERAAYYRLAFGSSKYDTRQMSVLIDGVLSEIKEMGLSFPDSPELERWLEHAQDQSKKPDIAAS